MYIRYICSMYTTYTSPMFKKLVMHTSLSPLRYTTKNWALKKKNLVGGTVHTSLSPSSFACSCIRPSNSICTYYVYTYIHIYVYIYARADGCRRR